MPGIFLTCGQNVHLIILIRNNLTFFIFYDSVASYAYFHGTAMATIAIKPLQQPYVIIDFSGEGQH